MEPYSIFLGALLVIREYQNWRDRKDLMDRIMCKNWSEYKDKTSPRSPKRGQPTFMTDEDFYKQEKEGKKC